ncbi:MAG: SDR family oxidoreductase [Actinomycetota bacterium]
MGTLEGRVCLVTGARGGVGRAVCDRFIAEGATVFAGDLQPGGSVGDSSAPGEFVALDVTDERSVQNALTRIDRERGRLDVVVNAAGIEIEETIENTSLEAWNRIFAVNATGTFLVSKHALPLLRKAAGHHIGGASIVNIGSYDGFIADPQLAAYCATKGAVHALTKAMACDHGPEGIRVNAVCPGYVDTPMLQSFFTGGATTAGAEAEDWSGNHTIDSLQQAVRDVHPLRTYGTPTDIANLIHWLACDEARYATGQLWIIDGGLSAQVQQMRL